jgi:putative hydrolase
MMGHVIDWTLTERVAGMLAGEPESNRGTPRPRLGEVAAESERLVAAYSGLRAPAPLPEPELLTRPDWVRANLRSLRPTLEPLADRLGEGLGPATPIVRAAGGALLAVELGVVIGYLSRRVLGQYELVILDPEAPPRLLFVAPNLDEAAAAFGADEDDLLTWVALHEVTHALQFAGVPWLRDHLAGLLREMLASVEVSIDPSRLLRLPSREDLRGLVDAVSQGGLVELVTTPSARRWTGSRPRWPCWRARPSTSWTRSAPSSCPPFRSCAPRWTAAGPRPRRRRDCSSGSSAWS